jgi:hypothetical protein
MSRELQQFGYPPRRLGSYWGAPTIPQAGLAPARAQHLFTARFRIRANYLGAAQTYLQANFLLEEPLRPEHITPRLLGHWGTVPGINFIYAHLNRVIREQNASVLLVTGPGHGAPANLANLYLEGTWVSSTQNSHWIATGWAGSSAASPGRTGSPAT